MKWVKTRLKIGGKTHSVEIETTGVYTKPKIQFSKIVCVLSFVFVVLIWAGNFVLAWFGKEPLPDAISIGFTIFGGFVTGGYFALCGYRDGSKNKVKIKHVEHGVSKDDAHYD